MRSERNVPYGIEDVNAAWLTGALQEAGLLEGVLVTELDVRAIGGEAGFLGQVALLTPTYSGPTTAPPTMILKIPIALKNRVLGQSLGVYESEIRFYTELKNKLRVRSPDHYYSALSAFDEPKVLAGRIEKLARMPILAIVLLGLLIRFFSLTPRRYVLLIEDLGHLQIGDQRASCGKTEMTWALTAMAKLHAPFWQSSRAEESIPWITSIGFTAKVVHLIFRLAARTYRKVVWPTLSARQQKLFDWVDRNGIKLIELLGEQPRTLLHGDFRLDNVCFDMEQSEVVLLDWQTMSFGSAGFELAYFLSSALSAHDCEATVSLMIKHYHAALAVEGIEVSADYLRWSYEVGMLAMLVRIAPLLHQGKLEMGSDRGPQTMQRWVDCIYQRLEVVDFESILDRQPLP